MQASKFYSLEKIQFYSALLFIFFLPFYDIPKTVKGGISLSFFFLVLFLLLTIKSDLKTNGFLKEFIEKYKKYWRYIIPLLLVFLCSSVFNYSNFTIKSLNHIIFYVYSFVVYSFGVIVVIEKYGFDLFLKVFCLSILAICLIGFVEFGVFYVFGFDSYARFLNHGANVGVQAGVPRIRSTFNEPSHLALFLIPVIPLILKYNSKIIKYFAYFTIFLTLSSSAFVGILIATIVVLIIYIFDNPQLIFKNKKKVYFILLVFCLAIFIMYPSIYQVFEKIIHLPEKDPIRFSAWTKSFSLFLNKPITGNGIASYYELGMPLGVFSWYLQILMETGIFGIIAILYLFLPMFKFSWGSRSYILIFSEVAFFIQMISMNHYYIPGIWILYGVIIYCSSNRNFIFCSDNKKERNNGEKHESINNRKGRQSYL